MIRFEPGPEACNGYFQISWTPSKIDSKQQLIHTCIDFTPSIENFPIELINYQRIFCSDVHMFKFQII